MQKPMVAGHAPTARTSFVQAEHVYFCYLEDPASLAEAIRTLKADPDLRERIARQGHALFLERFTVGAIGLQMRKHLGEIIARHRL